MLLYSKSDKLTIPLVEAVKKLPIVISLKNTKNLYVYGVHENRSVDIVMPIKFQNQRALMKDFQNYGLNVKSACYFSMAETYNYNVIGLGYGIRKNSPNYAKKVILLAYLTLNERLNYTEKLVPGEKKSLGNQTPWNDTSDEEPDNNN